MSRTLRVGVVGLGEMGRVHVLAVRATPGLQLVGVADRDPARLAAVGTLIGEDVARFADWDTMIDSLVPDLVILATPAAVREAPLAALAARPMAILCEKPLAPTAAEAARLIGIASRPGVRTFLCLQLRFSLPRRRLRDLVAGGAIGEPIAARAWFSLPGYHDSAPAWFSDVRAGGGVLRELGTHHIDQLRWILGEARAATGLTDRGIAGRATDHHASVLLAFAGGAIGEVTVSSRTQSTPKRGLEIHGTEGSVRLEDDERLLLASRGGTYREVDLPRDELDSLTPEDPGERYTRPLQHLYRHLAQVVADEADPFDLATFQDGRAVLRIIESAESGGASLDSTAGAA